MPRKDEDIAALFRIARGDAPAPTRGERRSARALFEDLGVSVVDRLAPGLAVTFRANCEQKDIARPAIEGAVSAARARLARVKLEFRDSDAYRKWRDLVAKLSDAAGRSDAVNRAPEEALARARKLLVAGADPAPAEAEHAKAIAEQTLHANRLSALKDAAATARIAAKDALRKILDAEQAVIHAAASAAARLAAAAVQAAVNEHAEALLVGQALAGLTHPAERISSFWGASGGLAGPLKVELP